MCTVRKSLLKLGFTHFLNFYLFPPTASCLEFIVLVLASLVAGLVFSTIVLSRHAIDREDDTENSYSKTNTTANAI